MFVGNTPGVKNKINKRDTMESSLIAFHVSYMTRNFP